MTRFIALALVALGLCGCRMVTSDRPIFTLADAAEAPALKPGLWALAEPGCRFNTKTEPDKWPECATALFLHGGAATDARKGQAGRRSVLIAGGDPAVIQAEADEGARSGFAYFGLRPLAADGDGMVTQARIWPAQCTPAPPVWPMRATPPLAASEVCALQGRSAVRQAVAASEAQAFSDEVRDAGRVAYWIRDKDR